MSLLSLALALALNAKLVFANACDRHKIHDPSVPECPSSPTSVLPESYPAKAVVLSDVQGKSRWVKSFVHSVLEAEPNKPPQFILNVNDSTIFELKKMIKARAKDKNQERLWLSTLSQAKGPRWHWQQDSMQSVVDANGRVSVRPNGVYRTDDRILNSGEEAKAARDSVIRKMREECDIQMGDPYSKPTKYESGQAGGNIEGGPGGLCIVGDSKFSPEEWSNFSKDICGEGSPFKAPTSFLKVGHADEIYSTIRTGPGECDIAIAVASPDAAMAGLKDDANGRASSDDPKGLYYSDLCDAFLKLHAPSSPPAAKPSTVTALFFEKAFAAVEVGGKIASGCPGLDQATNGQWLKAIQEDPNLRLVNQEIQERMTHFKDEITKKLANGKCGVPKFVDLPTAFMGSATAHAGRANVEMAKSIFPNPTNMQQFGNTLIIPDPMNEAIRDDIQRRISKLSPQLKVKFIDTEFAHLRGGNVHCSTNVVRYCRPRSKK